MERTYEKRNRTTGTTEIVSRDWFIAMLLRMEEPEYAESIFGDVTCMGGVYATKANEYRATPDSENYVERLEANDITFDWAVPQPWLNDIAERCGEYLLGWVWVYPEGSCFGLPCPRSPKALQILLAIGERFFDPRDLPLSV